MDQYAQMSRDQLLAALEVFAKSWLAHDGCWFLAVEERLGLEAAIELDACAWERFAPAEARRLMSAFDVPEGGGLESLARILSLRMYALINRQRLDWAPDRQTLRFVMEVCRVQETRRRKGLADFPCKSVGMVEFRSFAAAVDPRIRCACLHRPPEAPEGAYCAWEFSLADAAP